MNPFLATLMLAFLFSSPLSSDAFAAPPRPVRNAVAANAIRFVYRSFDGDAQLVCRHTLQSASSPYDWKIRCMDGNRVRGEFVAHVALSLYERQTEPAFSVELLYWLTSGSGITSEVGSTTWMHFGARSPLLEISTSQMVDDGTAGLYLEMNVEKMRARLTQRSPSARAP